MTYEPTALERHAAIAVAEAIDYLDRAQSLLDLAETALVQEESGRDFVPPSNQAKLIRYAEASAELQGLRDRFAP